MDIYDIAKIPKTILNACQLLYPEDYRKAAEPLQLVGLPREILDRIQTERRLQDLIVSLKEVRRIMGYNQSRWKDRALNILFEKSPAYLCSRAKEDRQVMKLAMFVHGDLLEDTKFCDDREIVKLSLRFNFNGLCHASHRLQDDLELVKIAVQRNPSFLQNTSEAFRSNMDTMKELAEIDKRCLGYRLLNTPLEEKLGLLRYTEIFHHEKAERASNFIKEFVIDEIKKNRLDLQDARHYRSEKEVVLQAVRQNGMALKHANPLLLGDVGVLLIAIHQNPKSFKYGSEDAREKISYAAVFRDPRNFRYVPLKLRQNDKELAILALKQDSSLFRFVRGNLREDKDILAYTEGKTKPMDKKRKRV